MCRTSMWDQAFLSLNSSYYPLYNLKPSLLSQYLFLKENVLMKPNLVYSYIHSALLNIVFAKLKSFLTSSSIYHIFFSQLNSKFIMVINMNICGTKDDELCLDWRSFQKVRRYHKLNYDKLEKMYILFLSLLVFLDLWGSSETLSCITVLEG